jgi:hypothetical protein
VTEAESPLPRIDELPPALVALLVEAKRFMRERLVGSLEVRFGEGGVPTLVSKLEQMKFSKSDR